jgi:YHS domain-containing protein
MRTASHSAHKHPSTPVAGGCCSAPRPQGGHCAMNEPAHQHPHAHPPDQVSGRVETVRDPVCGMQVDPSAARGGSFVHEGTTYFFCNPLNRAADHEASCTCRMHPLPAAMTVREARDVYLAENGFTMAAYVAPTTQGSFLGHKFTVPNPPAHQSAIRLHDLHHVATGFGTDHAGEGEISVWQLRRGLRGAGLYVRSVVFANALLGIVLAARRTLTALRHPSAGGSLFSARMDYDAILELSVGELRAMLAIPPAGLAVGRRGLHALAPQPSA